MGVDIQKVDCGAYGSQLRSCAVDFGVCAAGGILAGPPAGAFLIGLCGLSLMGCVDAADAAYPGCATANGATIVNDIKGQWLGFAETTCIPEEEN